RKREKIAREYLEKVGLGHRLHHNPNEISGGQRQRVAIARALVNQPSLLLADEPTGNLDSRTGEEIMELFHQLNEQGHTIILVTHEENIARHAQRILHIVDGEITRDEVVS
ncbi:MAG: ATP-binding cassette domain-containing protein, partial [Halanaerobiales bacterium]